MSDLSAWLTEESRIFSDKVGDLLGRCLPNVPDMLVTPLDQRVRIRPDGQTDKAGGIPLSANGQQLAWLRIHFSCRPDELLKHLAVDVASFWVVSIKDRSPLFRFEFCYDSRSAPHSHIQVHGERGALTHLLTKTRHDRPHEMSALHLPTGGSRFRPNLEDVLQFLIVECSVDCLDDWKAAVDERRSEWRGIQTKAAARAMPAEASEALRDLGYTVTPPPQGEPAPGRKARFSW